MVGLLPLKENIGVRIPGRQPVHLLQDFERNVLDTRSDIL